MTTYLPAAVIFTTMALTSRIVTDAIVNISLKHEAEELVAAVSDATSRRPQGL